VRHERRVRERHHGTGRRGRRERSSRGRPRGRAAAMPRNPPNGATPAPGTPVALASCKQSIRLARMALSED